MGTPTENDYTIDYSGDYALIAVRIAEVNQSLGAINQALSAILARMSDGGLGVYMRPLDDDARLSRGLTINALEQSGQIEAVREEMANPTPLP